MILYETMESLAKGILYLEHDHSQGRLTLARVKERFTTPADGGWSDMLFNINLPHQEHPAHLLPFEVQLVHSKMFILRHSLGGNDSYAQYRTAVEVVELF